MKNLRTLLRVPNYRVNAVVLTVSFVSHFVCFSQLHHTFKNSMCSVSNVNACNTADSGINHLELIAVAFYVMSIL